MRCRKVRQKRLFDRPAFTRFHSLFKNKVGFKFRLAGRRKIPGLFILLIISVL